MAIETVIRDYVVNTVTVSASTTIEYAYTTNYTKIVNFK